MADELRLSDIMPQWITDARTLYEEQGPVADLTRAAMPSLSTIMAATMPLAGKGEGGLPIGGGLDGVSIVLE